jgi:hypothetical protein
LDSHIRAMFFFVFDIVVFVVVLFVVTVLWA